MPPVTPPTVAQITAAVGSDTDARGIFSAVLMDLSHNRHSTEFFLATQMQPNWFPTVPQVEFVRLTATEAAALIATCGRYWIVSRVERRGDVASLALGQRCGGTLREYVVSFDGGQWRLGPPGTGKDRGWVSGIGSGFVGGRRSARVLSQPATPMKPSSSFVLVLAFSLAFATSIGEAAPSLLTFQVDAARVVEQMRGISMQRRPIARSDGRIDPLEQRRGEITASLHGLGDEAIGALARALGDIDVQMRRNAALVLIDLGGGYSGDAKPKVNTLTALSALIEATSDSDRDVRGWAAHAIAEMGPSAHPAVPALVTLLRDSEEGPRNTACLALGNIGPMAVAALPALRLALEDPSAQVRGFAQRAIGRIQAK